MTKQAGVVKKRDFILGALAGSVALTSPYVARAQTRVLRMSSWLPGASLITQNLFTLWADDVAQLTDGRVTIEFLPRPLGPPPAHLGLLQSGEADVAYSLHGYSKDAFLRARIGQFSFLGDAYGASHAFSKVYGKLLKAEEEHEAMTMLGLFQHGPGVLMLKNKVVRGPDDFRGLRLRTSGGYIAGLLQDMGCENVPMSPIKVREALLEGKIDGVAFPYEAGPAFNVMDQISFISELPGGYYNATWFLGMSNNAAQSIDPGDLDLIRKRSAQTVHVLAAKAFDYADYLGHQAFVDRGVPVEKANPELIEHIRGLGEGYESRWSSTLADGGYDGKKALAFTRRITGG